MSTTNVRRALVLVLALGAVACRSRGPEDDPRARVFSLAVDAVSDPGVPLAGVELRLGDHAVGTTNEKGRATFSLTGAEGGLAEVAVRCPAAHESPGEPLAITLRRFVPGSPPPTYAVRCPPTVRTVVAAIRAENGPDLPVMRLGKEVARTDATGIAHVLLEVKPGESVELTLATGGEKAARLRPQNPSLTFITKGHDDYVLLEQKFVEEKARPAGPARRVRRPSRI